MSRREGCLLRAGGGVSCLTVVGDDAEMLGELTAWSRPLPLYLGGAHLRPRYHPDMTSCPPDCMFKWEAGPDTTSYGWFPCPGLDTSWPPLLRVRGQQGMRAATRMTLARALQSVSTPLGPGSRDDIAGSLLAAVLPPTQRRSFQGCCLVPPGLRPSIRTRRDRIDPSVARSESYWELVDGHCGV